MGDEPEAAPAAEEPAPAAEEPAPREEPQPEEASVQETVEEKSAEPEPSVTQDEPQAPPEETPEEAAPEEPAAEAEPPSAPEEPTEAQPDEDVQAQIEEEKEEEIKEPQKSIQEVGTKGMVSGTSLEKKAEMKSGQSLEDDKAKKTSEQIRELREQRKLRGSKAKGILGSVISIHRLSVGDFLDKKGARYMNSYKLDSDNPFKPEKVKKILESVMVEAFENLTYDPDKCPKQAKWASSAIRAKVKELQFDRYKLICLVTIGEKTSQDVLFSCRFLWDVDRDRYATFSIENTYVFGIAQCFGVYYE